MNTLKNAALLIVMGGVLYFVYITLNKPPAAPGSSDVSLQADSLMPPDLQIESGAPAAEVPAAPPMAAFSTPAPSRGSQWQNEPAPLPTPPPATDMVATNAPSAYALPRDNAGGSTHDSTVTEPPRPESRPGGWDTAQNQSPPVAPEIIDYSGQPAATESAPPSTPAETPPGASSVYSLPPDTSKRVDPAVRRANAIEPIQPAASSAALLAYTVKQRFAQANGAIEEGRYREALVFLTELYKRPDLSPTDRAVLVQWLDALAGKVIYSPEHTLAEPYKASHGENLLTISQRMQVPWLLLQKINNVTDPQVVVPNTVLKVVPGPFHGDIDLAANEMTLYLKDMYAGRFPFTIGDEPPRPGQYQVRDKSKDQSYYSRDGRVLSPRDPSNPYGGWWIDLGSNVSLHGSPSQPSVSQQNLGCLSFSPKDADDIFSILSVGSTVTIR